MADGGATGDIKGPFNKAVAKFKVIFNRAPNAEELAQIEAHAHKHVQRFKSGGAAESMGMGLHMPQKAKPTKLQTLASKLKPSKMGTLMSLPGLYEMYKNLKDKNYPALQDNVLSVAENYAFPSLMGVLANPFEVHGTNEGEQEVLKYKREMNPYSMDAAANNRYPASSLLNYKDLPNYLNTEDFTGRYPALDAKMYSPLSIKSMDNEKSVGYGMYNPVTTGTNWKLVAQNAMPSTEEIQKNIRATPASYDYLD